MTRLAQSVMPYWWANISNIGHHTGGFTCPPEEAYDRQNVGDLILPSFITLLIFLKTLFKQQSLLLLFYFIWFYPHSLAWTAPTTAETVMEDTKRINCGEWRNIKRVHTKETSPHHCDNRTPWTLNCFLSAFYLLLMVPPGTLVETQGGGIKAPLLCQLKP